METLKKELLKRDLEIRKLTDLVATDPLTGLFNRRGFLELAKKLFNEASFAGKYPGRRQHFVIGSFAILFFDIDNFKKINDAYGHEVGDKLLKFVASVVASKVRSADFVGRWGGEEIVAALVGANERDAHLKAEEIRQAVKSRVRIPSHPELVVTVSAGVSSLEENISLEELIKRADRAMYQAKQQGRDRVVSFSELQ